MRLTPTTICTLLFCATTCLVACKGEPGDGNTDASGTVDATNDVSDAADTEAPDADAADAPDADDTLTAAAYFEQQETLAAELRCKRLYQCPEVYSVRDRKRLSAAAPRAACPDMLDSYYLSIPILGSIEAGRIDFDPESASACLDEYRAYLEADGCPDIDEWFDACNNVWEPTVPNGGACRHPSDCIGDAYCTNSLFDQVCEMGTCEPSVAEGEPCTSGEPWDCGDGLSCRSDGDEWLCLPPDQAPREGEPCDASRCGEGLLCNEREGVCVTAQIAEIGDVCDYRTVCPVGTKCSQDIGQSTMRCRTLAGEGEACVRFEDRCRLGLNCSEEGVCVKPLEEGDACEFSSECHREYNCYEGECKTLYEQCE